MRTRVYIAGPMTGLPDLNYPAFYQAAERLIDAGYDPINPARGQGRENCKEWLDFMRAALRDIANADGIALLPDWQKSKGARIEYQLALSLGLPIRTLGQWLNP